MLEFLDRFFYIILFAPIVFGVVILGGIVLTIFRQYLRIRVKPPAESDETKAEPTEGDDVTPGEGELICEKCIDMKMPVFPSGLANPHTLSAAGSRFLKKRFHKRHLCKKTTKMVPLNRFYKNRK